MKYNKYIALVFIVSLKLNGNIEEIYSDVKKLEFSKKKEIQDYCNHKIKYLELKKKFRELLYNGDLNYKEYEKKSNSELNILNKIDCHLIMLKTNEAIKATDIIRRLDLEIADNQEQLLAISKFINSFER